jgi:YVTN family beta-propeller protein
MAKTAFVTNQGSDTVSTIDVKTRRKNPTDIAVGRLPADVYDTPDGKTAFVANIGSNTFSTIDVKTRRKNPTDIAVGTRRAGSRSRRTPRPPSSPTTAVTRCRRLM